MKKCIKCKGHQKVDYEITNRGRKLLTILLELNQLIK